MVGNGIREGRVYHLERLYLLITLTPDLYGVDLGLRRYFGPHPVYWCSYYLNHVIRVWLSEEM